MIHEHVSCQGWRQTKGGLGACVSSHQGCGGGGGSGTSVLLEVAQNAQNGGLRSMVREKNRGDESRACLFQGRIKKREDKGARDHL